jgi:hypothetical protein
MLLTAGRRGLVKVLHCQNALKAFEGGAQAVLALLHTMCTEIVWTHVEPPCHGAALKDVEVEIAKGKHRIVYFDALVE